METHADKGGFIMNQGGWTKAHNFGLLAIIVIAVVAVWLLAKDQAVWAWLSVVVLMVAFVAMLGHGNNGRPAGILIDARQRVSLSRLQITLWTILVLSGLAAAMAYNLQLKAVVVDNETVEVTIAQALNIIIPPMLWALMGISTISMVGSPLILTTKKAKPENSAEKQRTKEKLAAQGDARDIADDTGQLVVNTKPRQAQWADIFKGEEVGNAANVDIAKVQMFLITLILVAGYFFSLVELFRDAVGKNILVSGLPKFSEEIVTLLAISHAGYLVHKGVPHSKPRQ